MTLEFTRHGPVVFADPEKQRAFAVRAAWLEPGMAPYFGSVEYMRAGSWREFLAALNRWGAPAENQVYADVDGNIGYKPAGLFPRRTSFDGLLPVPGDGRYEWEGYFDMDALPEEYNPERGFVATANAMNLPPDYPIEERRVGFEWAAPWRHRRVYEVLGADEDHSVEASLRLQRDYLSILAREAVALLPEVEDSTARRARTLLRGWDARLEPDSGEAALYVLWFYRHLRPGLVRVRFPEAVFELVSPMDTQSVLDVLRENDPQVRGLVERTLAEAFRDAQERMGEDPAGWGVGHAPPDGLRASAAGARLRRAGPADDAPRLPARWIRPHDEQHEVWRRGLPGRGRRLVAHGARRRRVGPRPHDERPGSIRRPAESLLRRPARALGPRRASAASLQPRGGGGECGPANPTRAGPQDTTSIVPSGDRASDAASSVGGVVTSR